MKTTNLLIKSTTLLCLFFLFTGPCVASVGTILYSKGRVMLNDKAGKKKEALNENDVITTGSNSLAILSLVDGSKVKVNENSQLAIDKVYKGKITKIHLNKGSSFFKVLKRKLMKKKTSPKFIVKSKTASLGVRGTMFFVSYGKNKTDDLWMCVNEGSVVLKANTEKKVTVVNKGEGVRVKDGNKTSRPKPLKWTEKLNWNMNPKSGQLKNNVSIDEAYLDLTDYDYD